MEELGAEEETWWSLRCRRDETSPTLAGQIPSEGSWESVEDGMGEQGRTV